MACKLIEFDKVSEAEVGDIYHFTMPSFCSGDYSFPVERIDGELVLKNAPSRIFDGCYDYRIERTKKNPKL